MARRVWSVGRKGGFMRKTLAMALALLVSLGTVAVALGETSPRSHGSSGDSTSGSHGGSSSASGGPTEADPSDPPQKATSSNENPYAAPGSPGYGLKRLEYDHKLGFKWESSSGYIKMEIAITGYVPLSIDKIGIGQVKCRAKTIDQTFLQMSGRSKLDVKGSCQKCSGLKTRSQRGPACCSCTFHDSIDVTIQGKTHYEPPRSEEAGVNTPPALQPDFCPEQMVSFQLKETWYTKPNWTCECSHPEDSIPTALQMNMLPARGNPGLESKTLKFQYKCTGASRQDFMQDPTKIGYGTYKWTWRSAVDEGSNQPSVNPSRLSVDDHLYPAGAPGATTPNRCPGEWGPPLESIPQPVEEWHPYGR
jgi:hypothetical protein